MSHLLGEYGESLLDGGLDGSFSDGLGVFLKEYSFFKEGFSEAPASDCGSSTQAKFFSSGIDIQSFDDESPDIQDNR